MHPWLHGEVSDRRILDHASLGHAPSWPMLHHEEYVLHALDMLWRWPGLHMGDATRYKCLHWSGLGVGGMQSKIIKASALLLMTCYNDMCTGLLMQGHVILFKQHCINTTNWLHMLIVTSRM